MNYTTLVLNEIANVLKFAGSFVGPDGAPLVIAGNALAVVIGVDSFLFRPSNPSSGGATFDHAFADVQKQIAIIQQNAQDLLAAQQHRVLSDANLLATVGTLVDSQLWTLDTAGALSVSRQQFTLWALQTFLPQVWDRWSSPLYGGQQSLHDGLSRCHRVLGGGTWLRTTDARRHLHRGPAEAGAVRDPGLNKVCEWTRSPSTTMTNLLFNPHLGRVHVSARHDEGVGVRPVLAGSGFRQLGRERDPRQQERLELRHAVREPGARVEGAVTSGDASNIGTPRPGSLEALGRDPAGRPPSTCAPRSSPSTGCCRRSMGRASWSTITPAPTSRPWSCVASTRARATQAEFTTPRGRLPQVNVRLKVDGRRSA